MAGLAREREPVVEQRGEAPDDREAEPHAGRARLVGAPRHLEELVEDALAVLGRDADAAVDDLDRDVAAAPARAEDDAAARACSAAPFATRLRSMRSSSSASDSTASRVRHDDSARPRDAASTANSAREPREQRRERHALAARARARRPRAATGR